MRQWCPSSAKLFIMFLADLEESLDKRGKGGIDIKGKKLYSLMYADDMVMLAKSEGGMKLMLEELRKYLIEKGLELNVGKTKVVRFGKRMRGRVEWSWGKDKIEEIKEIKYLGYVFKRNGRQDAQIKERIGRARGVMRSVWRIGKRVFKGDYKRRIRLFDSIRSGKMGMGRKTKGRGDA